MDLELADVSHKILSLDDGEQELMDEKSKMRKLLLQVDLKVEQLLHDVELSSKVNKTDTVGIRLPEINVLPFDGNILNWTSFWEHFEVSVHNKHGLQVLRSWRTSRKQ